MALDGYPRWAMEEYEGSEKDLSEWLYNAAAEALGFKKYFAGNTSSEVVARIDAEIKHKVLERTEQLDGLAQRAQMYQMWQAKKDNWFRNLPGEFGSLDELMASISDEAETPNSVASDLRFWANEMIPTLEAQGHKPEEIMSLQGNFSKARAAVPQLRSIIKTQTGEQRDKSIAEILEAIVDPSISARAFRDMMPLFKGRQDKPSIWGDVYNFPDYSMIVIRDADGGGVLRFLENRTRGTIEYRGPKDPIDLMKEITDVLMGDEDDQADT